MSEQFPTEAKLSTAVDSFDSWTEVAGATWRPIDLGPYLSGEIKPAVPEVGLIRHDGLALLYAGKEHAVIGEMESGKSWYSAASAAAELQKRNRVVYIHFEESDPTDTIERMRALGVHDDTILQRFSFVGPAERVDVYALAALLDPAPSLVILDGVNEAMCLHGQAVREEDGAAAFRRLLVKPCTAVGAAVLSADHVVKDPERRARGAIGSVHKGNALSGSLILLENAEPFGRGERGCSHVFVTKDRPGHLRQHGRPVRNTPGKTYVGSLVVDDTRTRNPWLELVFIEPQEQGDEGEVPSRDDQDDVKVLAVVDQMAEQGTQATGRSVRVRSGISKERTSDALERLVLDGKLRVTTGPRNARIYDLPESQSERSRGPVLKDRGPLDHSDDRSRDQSGPVGTTEGGDAA